MLFKCSDGEDGEAEGGEGAGEDDETDTPRMQLYGQIFSYYDDALAFIQKELKESVRALLVFAPALAPLPCLAFGHCCLTLSFL